MLFTCLCISCQVSPDIMTERTFVIRCLCLYLTNSLSQVFKQFDVSYFSCFTHTHTTILRLSGFCPGNPGEPAAEETFTHSHLSWSSIAPNLLHPSNSIHDILPVPFTCLTVFFHNLPPSCLWSTSWPGTIHFILHTFLHPIIAFFLQHMPIPLQPVLL